MNRALELAKQCFADPEKTPAFHNGFWTITTEELERFYALAKADALREAAARFGSNEITSLTWPEFELLRMAEELERQA